MKASQRSFTSTRLLHPPVMFDFLSKLLRAPRQTFLRRAMFQVHLWCGLVIGFYTAVIGLTGSILVIRPELEHLLRPQLYALSGKPLAPGGGGTLDDLLSSAERAQPSYTAIGLEDLPRSASSPPDRPLVLYMTPRPSSPHFAPASRTPDQLLIYLDPRDGTILGTRSRYAGPLGFTANLHYYLLTGASGYTANGLLALLFLLLCLTGWLLWWPGLRRVAAAVRIHGLSRVRRRGFNLRRLNWDLHTVGGFWSNPALIAAVITGVYFVFPRPLLSVAVLGRSQSVQVISEWFSAPPISRPHALSPEITVQQAWRAASAATPPDTHVQYLALPSAEGQAYEAIAYYPRSAPYAQPLRIFVDRYTGGIVKRLNSRSLPFVLRASLYVYPVHFGSFAGTASRVLWFFLGLTPGVLFLSGILMWWHRMRPKLSRMRRP